MVKIPKSGSTKSGSTKSGSTKSSSTKSVPRSIRLKWPVGPHYLRWVEGKKVHAWARYKLRSADWYLAALVATVGEAGDLDRFVGIEMALDGTLSSLCAAVDAAGFGLLEVLAQMLDPDVPAGSAAPGSWAEVFSIARSASVELACEKLALAALAGSGTSSPAGWLAQLQALRDLAVRHNLLARRLTLGAEPPGRYVEVPGLGPSRPIEYLEAVRCKVAGLVEALLAGIDEIERFRPLAPEARHPPPLAPRPLPDLSARAGLTRPT